MALPKEETVCFNIKFAWHAVNRMYNALGLDHEISTSVGFVLLNIDMEKGTPATKIGPILGMEPRSLTRMIKNLEEKGLIVRVSDPTDKRKVFIKLTDLGKEKRDISKNAVVQYNRLIRNHIPADQLTTFFNVIEQIQTLSDKKTVKNFESSTVHGNISI